jgi:hypothetical protein
VSDRVALIDFTLRNMFTANSLLAVVVGGVGEV